MTNTEEIKRLAEILREYFEDFNEQYEHAAADILKHYLPSSALVRPLVWEGSASHREANTIAGKYWIATRANGEKLLYFGKENFISLGIFTKEDEAKIAAQSHFNTLIGSCLQAVPETPPSGIEEFDALVDRYRMMQISLSALCDGLWNNGYKSGCLVGGGYTEVQVRTAIRMGRERSVDSVHTYFKHQEDQILSSLKQQ